jgi:thiamine kinase-like enzyme
MMSEWKTCLLERAAEWGLPDSGDWDFLLYNNYHPHCSDLDVFWFHNGGSLPRVVTKVSRERTRPEHEFARLRQVHELAPKWVPKPLHFGAEGNFWLLWMEGVPGTKFQGQSTPASLRAMVETVAGIHEAGLRLQSPAHPERHQRSVIEPLNALAAFGNVDSVNEGCRQWIARASPEWLSTLPVIPQHGDLYAGNLLAGRKQWYVIDWESYGMVDLPMYDLCTLLLSLLRDKGDSEAQWSPELKAQIPALVRQYAERLGLKSADVRILLPLTMANWFYIQWQDGRAEFSKRLYRTAQDYFEHEQAWERVFLPA